MSLATLAERIAEWLLARRLPPTSTNIARAAREIEGR